MMNFGYVHILLLIRVWSIVETNVAKQCCLGLIWLTSWKWGGCLALLMELFFILQLVSFVHSCSWDLWWWHPETSWCPSQETFCSWPMPLTGMVAPPAKRMMMMMIGVIRSRDFLRRLGGNSQDWPRTWWKGELTLNAILSSPADSWFCILLNMEARMLH